MLNFVFNWIFHHEQFNIFTANKGNFNLKASQGGKCERNVKLIKDCRCGFGLKAVNRQNIKTFIVDRN